MSFVKPRVFFFVFLPFLCSSLLFFLFSNASRPVEFVHFAFRVVRRSESGCTLAKCRVPSFSLSRFFRLCPSSFPLCSRPFCSVSTRKEKREKGNDVPAKQVWRDAKEFQSPNRPIGDARSLLTPPLCVCVCVCCWPWRKKKGCGSVTPASRHESRL